jgi:hypothetical protein
VHTARAQQSDDVQSVRLESGFDVLPASVLEDGFLFEGNINEGCTLSDDLSGTERVVADLSKRGLEKVTFWGEEKLFPGRIGIGQRTSLFPMSWSVGRPTAGP